MSSYGQSKVKVGLWFVYAIFFFYKYVAMWFIYAIFFFYKYVAMWFVYAINFYVINFLMGSSIKMDYIRV